MTLLRQVTRFGLIGVINTLVDIGSYTVLIYTGLPLLAAIVTSTSLGLLTSYVLNGRYTFSGSNQRDRATFARFLLVSGFGLWVLQPVVIVLLSHLSAATQPLQLVLIKCFATGVTMIWNFCWYKYRVFAAT